MFGGSLSFRIDVAWVVGCLVLLVGVGRVFVRGKCGMCFLVDDSIGGVAEFC